MREVRAPISDLAEGEHVLSSETSAYICRVRRLKAGDRFVAFDPATRREADATVLVASGADARVAVGPLRAAEVVATSELVVVYALAKGDKVDDVVRDASELGATRIVIARTERAVVKASADKSSDKIDRWRRIAEQAARQCGRGDPPAIVGIVDWIDALRSAEDCEARFCLDPHASQPLGALLGDAVARGASVAFAIGPEGGLSPAEVTAAAAEGFVATSLGRFVLRTETVAAAVLGAVRVMSPS